MSTVLLGLLTHTVPNVVQFIDFLATNYRRTRPSVRIPVIRDRDSVGNLPLGAVRHAATPLFNPFFAILVDCGVADLATRCDPQTLNLLGAGVKSGHPNGRPIIVPN